MVLYYVPEGLFEKDPNFAVQHSPEPFDCHTGSCYHFGSILGAFWDHFGTILVLFWDHFGTILGPFWTILGPEASFLTIWGM